MFCKVIRAMAARASLVKKAWWPVTITFGNVQETLEHIVCDDLTGEILEEQVRFLLVDVHSDATHLVALQGVYQRFGVDQRAATGRPVLTSRKLGLASASVFSLIRWRVCGVSGQCRQTMSAFLSRSSTST